MYSVYYGGLNSEENIHKCEKAYKCLFQRYIRAKLLLTGFVHLLL